ncbi:hypothetical protein P12x_005677 [Tundrisphaera lichenicola]|uniref:hypothetical protein n=1 Tax=Tundrisphaera lichenicola TaxID=2029860 RepID=UPI003EB725A9
MSEEGAGEERGQRRLMYHYTDRAGYNSIRAGVDWCFKANTPPPGDEDHPRASYFTTWGPGAPNLERLRLPIDKRRYVFVFEDAGDLIPLRGGRGSYILYFRGDYVVERVRQRDSGESSAVASRIGVDPENHP